MLLLTRKTNESIIIGDIISVKVLGVSGKSVRIGIDAPNDITVHREEVYRRIKRKEQSQKQLNEDSSGITSATDEE